MLILTFEEFNNRVSIYNETLSNIKIEDTGSDRSLIPIEILMRDQKPNNIREANFNFIVNLHPTDGTHWVSYKEIKC